MDTNEKKVDSNPFEGPDLSSSEDFFNNLDNDLGTVEHTEQPIPEPEQVTSQEAIPDEAGRQGNENVQANDTNWQKRYNDSSNEARRLKAENDELKPFKSVINFLKEDSGAVDLLQNYLKNGGQVPQTVQEELNLGEDFIFDMDDATRDPESDSGRLLGSMVEKKAQSIVDSTLQQERQKALQIQKEQARFRERESFMNKKGYTEEQMKALEHKAKEKVMTYEDLDYIINRDQVNQNVQRSTQEDMLGQMQAVRNIPTSIGGTNNAGQNMSSEEQFFNTMFGDQFKEDDNPF